MRVAIHQPNFWPHFGFFYKMSKADKFILLNQVQFEKGGYQNRYYLQTKKKWVTNPVVHGLEPLFKKNYTNGDNLVDLNIEIISSLKRLLGIPTKMAIDIPTDSTSTQRIIDNLNHYGATVYVTHPSAKDKYLDEDLIRNAGIDIEYCDHQFAKYNILEMFEMFGIEGTRNQLNFPKVQSGIA